MDEANSATHAVALKLSPFWTNRPQLWFAQAEAQFTLRGITTEMTRFYHVVASLDGATASRVEDVITTPPADAYATLKARLVGIYGLTDRERAARVLDAGAIGDRSPSAFMNELLQLVAGKNTDFIVREVFLRALPHDVATALASSTSDLRVLAAEADHHFSSTGARLRGQGANFINTVESVTLPAIGEVNATRRAHDDRRCQYSQTKTRPPVMCFYHAKFGSAARKCITPCIYTPTLQSQATANQSQGNANAGGRE